MKHSNGATMNFREHLERLLGEGVFVVKSLDGVEKRFKDANSPEAIEWKNKEAKKRKPTVALLDPSILINRACLQSLSWGEIDSSDVLMTQIVPFLYRNLTSEYPQEFADAVVSAKRGDGWKLIPYLDKFARRFHKEQDWYSYVETNEKEFKSITGGLDA